MDDRRVARYVERVGYTEAERDKFSEGGHRIRHVRRLSRVSRNHSIVVEVVEAHNCNSGHTEGQTFVLDADGSLITALSPKKVCVYLIAQLVVPIALINERFSEGLDPNEFHFMRQVQCPDAGVECMGYGKVRAQVRVEPRRRNALVVGSLTAGIEKGAKDEEGAV